MFQLPSNRQRRRHCLELVHHLGDRPPLFGVVEEVEDPIEVVGPHDHIYPGGSLPHQLPVLLSGTAADDQEHVGVGIFNRLELTKVAVEPVVGVLSDGAGVDEHHVGVLVSLGPDHSVQFEKTRYPLRVVFVHLTPEGADQIPLPGAGGRPVGALSHGGVGKEDGLGHGGFQRA